MRARLVADPTVGRATSTITLSGSSCPTCKTSGPATPSSPSHAAATEADALIASPTHAGPWVRHRKTLVKETKDEEVSVIERKVKYVCCRCTATGKTGCCGGEPAEHGGLWPHWLRW